MEITVEKEFGDVFKSFIEEQIRLPGSCRISVNEVADYIRELIFLLPNYEHEAIAILTALKDRDEPEITQLVKDGLR